MLTAEHLTKRFGDFTAVDNVSFSLPQGRTLAILGTSGSGKSTLLRLLNRLLEPDSGRVLLDGADTAGLPVHELRRRMGYVIQHIGLFPHYTVAENIATVPRLLGWQQRRIEDRIDALLSRLGLPPGHYRRQYPHQLSGGQQQRVGLARALAADPPVVLMDEPFGALDNITREDIRRDFRELEELRDKTIILVTHDTTEAFELGDQVAIMRGGRFVQAGTPRELLFQPADPFVADFLAPQRLSLQLRTLTLGELAPHLDEDHTAPEPLEPDISVFRALEQLDGGRPRRGVVVQGRVYGVDRASVLKAFAEFT